MEVRFDDPSLSQLDRGAASVAGWDAGVAKAFRQRLQFIRAAVDERAFYAMKSLHYEQLKGHREGHRAMRLNDAWRLMLRVQEDERGRLVVIVAIAGYP